MIQLVQERYGREKDTREGEMLKQECPRNDADWNQTISTRERLTDHDILDPATKCFPSKGPFL